MRSVCLHSVFINTICYEKTTFFVSLFVLFILMQSWFYCFPGKAQGGKIYDCTGPHKGEREKHSGSQTRPCLYTLLGTYFILGAALVLHDSLNTVLETFF